MSYRTLHLSALFLVSLATLSGCGTESYTAAPTAAAPAPQKPALTPDQQQAVTVATAWENADYDSAKGFADWGAPDMQDFAPDMQTQIARMDKQSWDKYGQYLTKVVGGHVTCQYLRTEGNYMIVEGKGQWIPTYKPGTQKTVPQADWYDEDVYLQKQTDGKVLIEAVAFYHADASAVAAEAPVKSWIQQDAGGLLNAADLSKLFVSTYQKQVESYVKNGNDWVKQHHVTSKFGGYQIMVNEQPKTAKSYTFGLYYYGTHTVDGKTSDWSVNNQFTVTKQPDNTYLITQVDKTTFQ